MSIPESGVPSEPLRFTRHDVTSLGVPSVVFSDSKALCGIYILEFGNGFRYVGQTVNIINRSGSHRRHHGDVTAISFAPCARRDLDYYERQTIAAQEETYDLRNKLLTNQPGGAGTLRFEVSEGSIVELPWDRTKRKRAAGLRSPGEPSLKHATLSRRSDFNQLASAMATYIDQTIPDPIGTAGTLWNLTVLPQTGGGRILTLNCGSLETMWAGDEIRDGRPAVWVALNIAFSDQVDELAQEDEDDDEQLLAEFGILAFSEGRYKRALTENFVFDSWESFENFVSDPEGADAAYRLNVQMMRQGMGVYRRFHDASLADRIMELIVRGNATGKRLK